MKNIIYLILTLLVAGSFTGCEEEDLANGGDPVIYYVRITEPNASDSLLVRAYAGTMIAIIGDNLGKTEAVLFNDRESDLLPVYVTNTSILVTVPDEKPTEVNDKITLRFSNGSQFQYDFESYRYPKDSILNPQPVAIGEELTIIGTSLDIVSGIQFPDVEIPVTSFVSQSATQIKVIVPEGSGNGFMKFVTKHGVWSDFSIKLQLPDLTPLNYTIYDESLDAILGLGGGWGSATTELENAENAKSGGVSIKATFGGGWGGASQFGNWSSGGSISTAGMSSFTFYMFGGEGTGGRMINLGINGAEVAQIEIVEGEWKEVVLPLSEIGNPAGITEIWFQDRDWSGTVYIDYMGLLE